MNLEEMIRAIQTKLGTEVDGKAGPQTWKAIYETIVGPITAAKQPFGARPRLLRR